MRSNPKPPSSRLSDVAAYRRPKWSSDDRTMTEWRRRNSEPTPPSAPIGDPSLDSDGGMIANTLRGHRFTVSSEGHVRSSSISEGHT